MNFITDLPQTIKTKNDEIMVITDVYTKMTLFIPVKLKEDNEPHLKAKKTAELITKYIFCRFDIPKTIVTDRDDCFINDL
jgi:hypothetical protein